jgi:phosphatidylglycerol:prolipoprotein diacylglycerol transferase
MNPIAFQVGGLTVYWYGILIVAGVLAGAYVATIQARRRQQNPEHVWDALLVCLVLGIIGARIYHVFSTSQGGAVGWPYYREHPQVILKIWEGGLGLIGAIIGGALGMVVYARFARLPVLTWLDIGAYGLLLAQVVGRWGNYINQELYGPPTDLPWGIRIDTAYRVAPFNDMVTLPPDTRFHPLFLYESLWCLVGFALLWWLGVRLRDWLLEGDIFFLYLLWYPLGRFAIEFLRLDAWMAGPVAVAQIFSACAMVLVVTAMVYRHRRHRVERDQDIEPHVSTSPPVTETQETA